MDVGEPPFPRPASKWWFGCDQAGVRDHPTGINGDQADLVDAGKTDCSIFSTHHATRLYLVVYFN